jgi:rhodanese-related sulfurtransferase
VRSTQKLAQPLCRTSIFAKPNTSSIVQRQESIYTQRIYSQKTAQESEQSQEQQEDEYRLKYPAWESISYELNQKYGVSSIPPQKALDMMNNGEALLVDVRPKESYDEGHSKGAINVPAFRVINMADEQQGGGLTSMLRFAVMKFNGVTPTEANPEFPERIQTLLLNKEHEGKAVILMCTQGGSLTPTTTFPAGKVSRSLKACWRLLHNKAITDPKKVLHVDGGIKGWSDAGLDME